MFEWAECSGAVLAKMVADRMSMVPELPDDLDGDAELYALVHATRRTAAWSAAVQARIVATAYERSLAEHRRYGLVRSPDGRAASAAGPSHGYDDETYTRSEIAANLALEQGITLAVADRQVSFALILARHPDLWLTLAVGRLDEAQAVAAATELEVMADHQVARRIVRSLVTPPESPEAGQVLVKELRRGRRLVWDLPPGELRSIIRREAAALDPEVDRLRAESARGRRHVRYHALRDGMAELVLHGPAEQLSAAYQQVDTVARSALAGGSTPGSAGVDQLRHDIAVGWLTGSADASSSPQVSTMINITIAGTTLLGLDECPATLHGPQGDQPIPAELTRELAHDPKYATWRRILCDPDTGVATDVSRGYRPAPRIATFVKVRDGYRSRFPVTSGGGRIELDHVTEYRPGSMSGGATTASNLASSGVRDHHLKTDRGLRVRGDANDVLTFTARTGRQHLSPPYPYVDPRPPRPPDSPEGRDPPF
jgi:hypothetical protein